MSEFKKGDRVVFCDAEKHLQDPRNYPPVGTVGFIAEVPRDNSPFIQWTIGSTSDGDAHYCSLTRVKPYRIPFDLHAFKRGEFAVNCETEGEAENFLRHLESAGVKWRGGDNPTLAINWSDNKSETSYQCIFGPCELGYGNIHGAVSGRAIHKYRDLQFKEENTMQERLAKLETRQREVADKIKAIRETPDFTLDGFLRGEFAIVFSSDTDKGMFLGWLSVKSNIKWGNGYKPTEYRASDRRLIVQDGKLLQGNSFKPDIPFSPSILTETPSNKPAELHALEIEQRSIADEIQAVRKEMEKPCGYAKPEQGEKYWRVDMDDGDIDAASYTWNDDCTDNSLYDSGNCYPTEAEAQRVADMLNYFFLVQRKARELGGFLGCGHDVSGERGWVIYYGSCFMGTAECSRYSDHLNPLQPIMTRECAEALAKDPEVIKATRLAWGVK